MRVVSNKLTIGLLGGALSVLPIGKAVSAKAAVATGAKTHPSTLLASVGENLKGVAKDTYNASENFMTSPTKDSKLIKLGIQVPSKLESALKKVGAVQVARTESSTIYDLSKESASELRIKTIKFLQDEIEQVRIEVPNGVSDIKGCLTRSSLRGQYQNLKGGGTCESTVFVLTKEKSAPLFVEVKKYRLENGKEFTTETNYFKLSKSETDAKKTVKNGISETCKVDKNGKKSIEYRQIDSEQGDIAIEKDMFEDFKLILGNDFSNLLP